MFGFLNVHSNYSLLRGVPTQSAIIDKCKEMGCDAVGIVDSHNLYGVIPFYKKAKEEGIKALLGVTLYLKHPLDERYHSLVLIASSFDGYKNLLILVTLAQVRDSATPYVTLDQLEKHNKDIICILPPHNSSLREALIQKNEKKIKSYLNEYKKIFTSNLYLGITNQNLTVKNGTKVENYSKEIIQYAEDIPAIPFPLVYILDKSDIEARSVLFSIQKMTLSPLEEDLFEDPLVMPGKEEFVAWCKEIAPKSLDNISKLIESTNVNIPIGHWDFPNPPIKENQDPEEVFKKFIEEGYRFRRIEKTKKVLDRVSFEFDVIKTKGYINYFLSVIDLIRFMKENNILSATRGSAAGSMISYLCGITNVDPLEYKLPFERFLNPFRPSPPDVDLDIADNKRALVIDYIIKKYGKKRVAQIGTIGTMMARAAVRDTARALGYSYTTGDRIAKLIPLGAQGAPMYIDTALSMIPELKNLYKTEESVKHTIDIAKKIEGNPRHMSVHAAGIVISPTVITDYTSLECDPKSTDKHPITQFNMHSLEDVGLLKFDILGLTNLSILSRAFDLIEKDLGIKINPEKIPLDDKKTFEMLSRGYTRGVFQVGGAGMTTVLKKLKPSKLQDLAAVIALYRPGPSKNIDEYIDRKNGIKEEHYHHPDMKSFLKDSYGVLVYQDDLLYTALELAGYDWEEVDVFRKAVGKKIPELLATQEKLFKTRVQKLKGLSSAQANAIWELFIPFKGYGFNKAHALSYAKISYLTAYAKVHYTAQYMASHLTAANGDIKEVADLVYEVKRFDIKVSAPDINYSIQEFTTEPDGNKFAIRIGFNTIKNVGANVSECIVSEREKNGKYISLEDFLQRIGQYKVLNRRGLEALIKVGVFDSFNDRTTILENIELLLQSMKNIAVETLQATLFEVEVKVGLNLKQTENLLPKTQLLYWEKELLGVYVSGHPLEMFKKEGLRLTDIKNKKESKRNVLVTAVISNIKPHRNKKGEKMYFITLEDNTNEQIESVCFPEQAEEFQDLLAIYRPVRVKGVTTIRNDEVTLRIVGVENPIYN